MKEKLYDVQQRLKPLVKKGRWKYIDNFHLTLKFLSEVSYLQREQIDEAMLEICKKEIPFSLEVKELGIFPGRGSIRVLWLGLSGDIPALQALHKRIDVAVAPIGYEPEKRAFSPHVTIGQDIWIDGDLTTLKDELGSLHLGNMEVNCLHLFKSEQIQHKRVYTKISEYRLLGSFRN